VTSRSPTRSPAPKPPAKRPPKRPPAPALTRPDFGPRLQTLREQCGHTQTDLAVKIDVSIATISRWERGQSEPRIEQIIGISDALGLSIDQLLGGGVAAPDPMPDALMLFLRSAAGRLAIEAGLLPTLRHLRLAKPPTLELYRAITVALLGAGAGED